MSPSNAEVNSLLGELLIHIGQNEQAAKVLEVAYQAAPQDEEHWIRLLAAHHRAGNLVRCRELLVLGEGLIPKAQLDLFAHGISQPPANRINALIHLFKKKKNYLSAEISAWMFIEDFPEHPFGWAMLHDVLNATGREPEAASQQQPIAI
jgi:tetratricopeptide (TPR) repeat protein